MAGRRSGLCDDRSVRLIGNLIWLIFAGLWMAILYVFFGILLLIPIITIPFSLQSFKLASFALWPFGRTIVRRSDAGAPSTIGNVIWFVLAGIWLAIGHLITSIPLFISIIGIPLGIGNLKMIPISLTPFGREIVPIDSLGQGETGSVSIGS